MDSVELALKAARGAFGLSIEQQKTFDAWMAGYLAALESSRRRTLLRRLPPGDDIAGFGRAILDRVCLWHHCSRHNLPQKPIFLRTEPPPAEAKGTHSASEQQNNLSTYYRDFFKRDASSAKWLVDWICSEMRAGHLPWLERKKTARANGFVIQPQGVIQHLNEVVVDLRHKH